MLITTNYTVGRTGGITGTSAVYMNMCLGSYVVFEFAYEKAHKSVHAK